MLKKLTLAAAALVVCSAPVLAATAYVPMPRHQATGGWTVIQNASDQVCYTADRGPGPGESRVAGYYRSEAAALAALGNIAACNENEQTRDS